ncbi:MAG TPA: ATP-binding protein, partial [Ramlibacter sp.]
PDDLAGVKRELADGLRAEVEFSLQLRIAGADGQHRWWLLRGVPVQENGRLVKWVGTCTDVDEIKQAQHQISRANRALQQQRSELRTLFDVVPAMVWLKDAEGRVVQLNHRAASFCGMSVEQACGRLMTELFPLKAQEYSREDALIFSTGKPLPGRIEQVFDADGRALWVQTDKVPCFAPDGSIAAVMVMKQDITERAQAQESLRELNESLEVRVRERTAELALARDEAERANRAKSTFLAIMSHEIRTPMSGLLGLLELLDLSWLDQEQRSTLRVARESGQALKAIIDGILDFSRIEANSLELDAVPASLRAVVDGVARLHAPVAAGKHIALTTVVDPDIGESLRFDSLRLSQILNNFVGNAVKFTEQGSISVQAELLQRTAGREHLRLTVRDTGIGIAPDRVGRLFQPFAQAQAQTSSQYGGTGLGLFIARRLAELMQGTVSLDSEPGKGTTLTLNVVFDICEEGSTPERQSEATREQLNDLVARRPAPPTLDEAEADGTLLLVVDDHPINRMLLMRQVSTLGYAAESAADGVHALKAWESGRFAAVITDCNMPRMNGYELARTIRAREAERGLRRAPVIGCTASALAEAATACLEAGMDDTVTKPVSLEDICTQLDRWIPLPSLRGTGPQAVQVRPAPQAANGLLDMALLDTVAGGDPSALAQVMADFRRTNDDDAVELRRAVRREDFAQAVHFSHRIRGACAMLGATLLADASAMVQESAATRHAVDVHASMQEFEMELLRLNNYLDTLTGCKPK